MDILKELNFLLVKLNYGESINDQTKTASFPLL